MKLIKLLKEITVNTPGGILPQKLGDDIEKLLQYFGEGTSGFSLTEPLESEYELADYEPGENDTIYHNQPEMIEYTNNVYRIVKYLCSHFPNKKMVFDTNILSHGGGENSFDTLLDIKKDKVIVSQPYVCDDGDIFVGWFDSKGTYHPDTENYNEKGEYIGDDQAN
jgi:hypothetical protein